ncbi:hypothetical protein PIB30_029302 [Stylosanthes scabra]|uniref:NB-ARC domain-containing protein n=1 Tax=Stylosanthes scabra TaxID=79078 RepID=A0ABU6X9C5_9FABA|nr:hypothetical protein [Stylosanthes scabra]
MEFLTSLATEAITKLGTLVVRATVDQFKYVIHHKKIVADLKEEHERLKKMKTALERLVEEDGRRGVEINDDVKGWLKKVQDIDAKLEGIYAKEDEANKQKKCSNLASKYSVGKQATKNARNIEGLIKDKEEEYKSIITSLPKSPPKFGPLFTQDIKALGSRKEILKKVMEKLKDDKVKRISVCGLGGVGKTTLAMEVINNVETSKLFDKFAFAAVSQDPDYEKIQMEIAAMLQYNLEGKTMQVRAAELHKHVTGEAKSVLIVLDDIWHHDLDFKLLGLPSLEQQQQRCKILFTSRDKKVCQSMECVQENIIEVPVLTEPEDWHLFREMAGDVVDQPGIKNTAKEIAKECGGLPLALVVVARALAKEEDKHAWIDACNQLKSSPSSSFPDMQKLVYSRIEKSVSFLQSEEQKRCLWLCGLYPEDFDIPVESLLRHGMGMGVFKVGGALWKARSHVHTLILQLKRCFLLLDSAKPGCVKMHDVVRDAVISIENGFLIQDVAKLKSTEERKLDHIQAISLVLDDTKELESDSEYPALQLLQVRSKSKDCNPWPEHFFQGMSKLKVLGMENLCIVPPLPSLSFQAMTNLHTLRIEYCDVGDISVIGKEFPKLQVLSFAYSNIEALPTQIGELSSLRLLDLTGCNDLCFISTDVFKRLTQLEELYFGVENFPWIHHKDVLEELKSLANHMKVIEIKVSKVEILPEDLTFKSLVKFWVYIVPHSFIKREEYFQSNMLQMKSTNYISIENSSTIKELFKKCEVLVLEDVKFLNNVYQLDEREYPFANLKDLKINSCPDLQCLSGGNILLNLVNLKLMELPSFSGFSEVNDMEETTQPPNNNELGIMAVTKKLFTCRWLYRFPKLETILLEDCESLEMVFDLQGCTSQLNGLFPQLKEIKMDRLSNLIDVWGNAPNCVYGFQNVMSLSISRCNSLKHAFTPAIVKAMAMLENLEVKSCELMESLVGDEGRDEEHEEGDGYKVKIISFEKLHSLILGDLSNIEIICPSSWDLNFPSIRKLQIGLCPKLKISSLLTPHEVHEKLHNNLSSASDDSPFEESHPRKQSFGCTSFCSNLIPYKNTSEKSSKVDEYVPSYSERKLGMSRMPHLQEFDIYKCELHDKVLLQEGDHQRIMNFPTLKGYLFTKLTSLTMEHCNNIFVLLSLSALRTLECLEKLEVMRCKNVEQIISQEELETSENKLMFPKLRSLVLWGMLNLKAFCQDSCLLDFPSLRKLEIRDCPKIKVFSGGSCHTPKLEDVQITGPHGSNNIQNVDLNAAIQGFKAFEALHESEIPRWSVLCNEDKFSYFTKTTELAIEKFHKMAVLAPSNEIHALQHLRELDIQECETLVELFESERGTVANNVYEVTYKLQRLGLIELPRLRHIWLPNIVRLVNFKMLTSIEIQGCGSLKSVLSESMAKSLVKLQQLYVVNCAMIEEIVTMDDGGTQLKTLLPNLEGLYLEDLPKLECVCSRVHHEYDILLCDDDKEDKGIRHLNNNSKQQIEVSFPQLKDLYLSGVPRLKSFCPGAYDYDIMLDEHTQITNFPNDNVTVTVTTPKLDYVSSSFGSMRTSGKRRDVNLTIHYLLHRMKYKEELQQLETFRCITEQHQYQHLLGYITRETELEVERCQKLLTCVPSNMMHLFHLVYTIRVEQCECLEEIFESNDYGGPGTQLQNLYLGCLPKLKHIWRNHASISGFENLGHLTIRECHELKFVFPDVSVAKSLPRLRRLEVEKCNKMKEIISSNNNNSIQKKGAKIIFPLLEIIALEKLSSLSCFCSRYLHFELPWCWYITIKKCPKMETFCFGTVYTPKLETLQVEEKEIGRKEDVNEVIKEEFSMAFFDSRNLFIRCKLNPGRGSELSIQIWMQCVDDNRKYV